MISPIKTLYIIGNGFDLHHGLHTSYADFREWLEYCHPIIYNELRAIYGEQVLQGDWWADFENSLGRLNFIHFYSKYHTDTPDRVWKEAKLNNDTGLPPDPIWTPAGKRLRSLYFLLNVVMEEWIKMISMSIPCTRRINISQEEAFFITFNYTPVLERIYKIPQNKILHIHGYIGEEELVFGHGESAGVLEYQYRQLGKWKPDGHDVQEVELAFDKKGKNPYEYIAKYNDIFQSLNNVQCIHVYGLSFSSIDMPYLTKIQSIASHANWNVSYYGEDGKEKINKTLENNIYWKKTDINWITLNELIATR